MKIETVSTDSLVNKTIFFALHFERFGAVRKVNVEIKSDALVSRFKHQKKLLNSPELKEIVKADTNLKAEIDNLAAGIVDGIRILPSTNVETAYLRCKNYAEVTRPALIDAFLATLDSQIAAAKAELKEHFNFLDYPTHEEMKKEFKFAYHVLNFGTPDILKEIAPSVYAEETAKIQQQVVEMGTAIADGLAITAHTLVANLADQLSADAEGKVRKMNVKSVSKLQDFLNTFDLKNVTNHVQLQGEMNKLKALTEGIDPEQVKENDGQRLKLQSGFAEIAASLSTMVEVKGRKFRDVPQVDPATVELAGQIAEKFSA